MPLHIMMVLLLLWYRYPDADMLYTHCHMMQNNLMCSKGEHMLWSLVMACGSVAYQNMVCRCIATLCWALKQP